MCIGEAPEGAGEKWQVSPGLWFSETLSLYSSHEQVKRGATCQYNIVACQAYPALYCNIAFLNSIVG